MLYEPQYYHDHLDDMAAIRDAMIASMATMEGWIGQLEACIRGDTHARLAELDVPTLITCSDKDALSLFTALRSCRLAFKTQS